MYPKVKRNEYNYTDLRGRGLDNLFKMNDPGDNEWGIPDSEPFAEPLGGVKWLGFWDKSKHKSDDWSNVGLHFFSEEYQYRSVWEYPDRHLDLFRRCRAVVTPDYSVYTDMPKAQQLWNHYRRQWLARYWQMYGVNVVSCVTWDLLDFRPWSICGIPKGTSIARSWVNRNGLKRERLEGFMRIIEMLEPRRIYIKCSETDERELRRHFDFDVIPPVRW